LCCVCGRVYTKVNQERKTKKLNIETEAYKYNPTVKELREAYEVAYGEYGAYHLIGAMFASMNEPAIERVYQAALSAVRSDLKEKGLL
jgi:hypothetical protein